MDHVSEIKQSYLILSYRVQFPTLDKVDKVQSASFCLTTLKTAILHHSPL